MLLRLPGPVVESLLFPPLLMRLTVKQMQSFDTALHQQTRREHRSTPGGQINGTIDTPVGTLMPRIFFF